MRSFVRAAAAAAAVLVCSQAWAADLRRPDAPPDPEKSAKQDEAVKAACDRAIADWAKQFDPIKIDTVITGSVGSEEEDRTRMLDVTIDYKRESGVETRQAKIECTVGHDGSVAVKESK